MLKDIVATMNSSLIFWLLTSLIYPFFLIFFSQTFFPYQANGSLIKNNQDQFIFSALIGQTFTSDRHSASRPRVIHYCERKELSEPTGLSGAGNLASGNLGATIARNTAYAIGILLLVTISLSIYLFTVIFQPERF